MAFGNMKVAARLAWAFGLVLVLMGLTGAFTLTKLAAIETNLEDIVLDNNVKIKLNNQMAESVHVSANAPRCSSIAVTMTRPGLRWKSSQPANLAKPIGPKSRRRVTQLAP